MMKRAVFAMRKSILPLPILIVALFLIGGLLSRAAAQTPVRQLTTSGDVMEFIWAAEGDALYVVREGEIVSRGARRQQITGDLYRVDASSGAGELLARTVNGLAGADTGESIAFSRLQGDGSAQLIVYSPSTRQERVAGIVSFGANAQWNRAGETLYFVEQGRVRSSTATERATILESITVSNNARVSSQGDRVAEVDELGLWVTQVERERVFANENGARVLPQVVWSHHGAKLGYIVTRNGFDPQLWVVDTVTSQRTLVAEGSGLEYFSNPAWSPDDEHLIFTRMPTGTASASHSEIWRARADGTETIRLTANNAEESLPQYSPDGGSIAFLREGNVWVMDLDAQGLEVSDSGVAQASRPDHKTARAVNVQRTAPATIRVRHDAANACRSVPIGQIDIIDFELYVKRVVPSEVYPSWDDDALKTQAVAARSYAWFWILEHSTSAFDVTDTTAYQYMCETQYASTDNASEGTRGQYLDYAGNMVFAAYGAENGDPTLSTTWGNPYLLAVDDPVGFMKTRAGNGIGYSQWGAQRWATQYDWNYQQILLHYYSNVTVQAAAGSGNDVTAPIGAIVSPWQNWGVTSTHVHFKVNASDELSGIDRIELWAQYQAGNGPRNELIATLHGDEREFVWDVTSLANQTGIRVTPILYDGANHNHTGAGITFELDRKTPQGTVSAPATTTNQTVTLNLNASDAAGGTLATMMFSNDWEWQGEGQFVEANSATVVSDPDALNGTALRGQPGVNPAGAWYGPYTPVLPNAQPYRAYFRLKTDNNLTTHEVALLDVVVNGGAKILGMKRLRGVDFKSANEYQEFYVEFYYNGFSTNGLEFRTSYRANAALWLDCILVVRYPGPYASSTQWTLPGGEGYKRVIAKFGDRAGNVSPDAVSTIFFGQNPPATLVPRSWLPFITRQE